MRVHVVMLRSICMGPFNIMYYYTKKRMFFCKFWYKIMWIVWFGTKSQYFSVSEGSVTQTAGAETEFESHQPWTKIYIHPVVKDRDWPSYRTDMKSHGSPRAWCSAISLHWKPMCAQENKIFRIHIILVIFERLEKKRCNLRKITYL